MNIFKMFEIELSNHNGEILTSDDIEISENEFQKIVLSRKSDNKFTGAIKSSDFFEVESIEISCNHYDKLKKEKDSSKYNLKFKGLLRIEGNDYSADGTIAGLMIESYQSESTDEFDKIKVKSIKFIPSKTTKLSEFIITED